MNRKAEGYNPLCGDKITVFMYVEGDVINDLGFQGTGCAISKASASMMTDALKGKTLKEAEAFFDKFHTMLTVAGDVQRRNGRARQAGRAFGRARVSDAREVREPGVAHAQSGDAGGARCRLHRITTPTGERVIPLADAPAPQPQAEATDAAPSGAFTPDPLNTLKYQPLIVEAVSKVFDPEIPVNIYELGLVYDIDVDSAANVSIRMTLTAPACPAAQTIPVDVERRVREVTGCQRREGCGRLGSAVDAGSDV